jgi:hypothetical protein
MIADYINKSFVGGGVPFLTATVSKTTYHDVVC